ncbi:hypothetical protein C8A05DRAFT_36860 [Staphylotrichum tortipilum]|uniref:Uncharacterized protein n=1 Tax=Staphylotrichum tortipilum TaxID=2831512 RepID=A0AAN6MFF1_9PEZI|nr:hypothetical protein C8A05DRAFT_36860 [Staphylotrichum longicolle]
MECNLHLYCGLREVDTGADTFERFTCIGVITATPTSSVGANGVTTPLPIHTGMVTNCKKFVKINSGGTCNIVAFYNGPISTENFVLRNTGIGGMACTNLQAIHTYVCVGV